MASSKARHLCGQDAVEPVWREPIRTREIHICHASNCTISIAFAMSPFRAHLIASSVLNALSCKGLASGHLGTRGLSPQSKEDVGSSIYKGKETF